MRPVFKGCTDAYNPVFARLLAYYGCVFYAVLKHGDYTGAEYGIVQFFIRIVSDLLSVCPTYR